MSSEPEKPIEKLLRRWSSERRSRAGDPWEIHPATRRLWQEEVARKFGQKRPSAFSWFSRYFRVGWLGPATALGSLAALIITGWIIWSSPRVSPRAPAVASTLGSQQMQTVSSPMQLTANDKAPLAEPAVTLREEEAKALAAANPPAAFDREKTTPLKSETQQDNGAARESLLDKANSSTAIASGFMKTEPQSAPAAASSPAPPQARSGEAPQRYGLGRGLQSDNNIASASPSVTVPLSLSQDEVRRMMEMPALATLTSGPSDAVLTNVVQYGLFSASQTVNTSGRELAVLSRRSFNAPSASADSKKGQLANGILVSFRVEQSGEKLRVIDSDNSVYTGTIRDTNLEATAAMQAAAPVFTDTKQKTEAPLNQKIASQNLGVFFRVTGTNLTSNQRVVFSGLISGVTNDSAIAGRLQSQRAGGVGGMSNFAPGNQQTQNLRLNGKALIGRDQEVQIDAVPVSR